MKATGIVRRIDDLGRIVFPKELRRTMDIKEGDPMEIFTDGRGSIVVKKYNPNPEECHICHADHDLIEVDGTYTCQVCIHRLADKIGR